MGLIDYPIQHIQYMYRDKLMADIWFSYAKDYIKVSTYSDDWMHLPFGKKSDNAVTLNDLDLMLEERCFERESYATSEILKLLDMPCYEPLAIVHKTHGYLVNDDEWIRFDDDPPELSLADLEGKWKLGH